MKSDQYFTETEADTSSSTVTRAIEWCRTIGVGPIHLWLYSARLPPTADMSLGEAPSEGDVFQGAATISVEGFQEDAAW